MLPDDSSYGSAVPHPFLARADVLRGRSAAGRFVGALLLPLRAAGFLLRQPRLWPLVAVPALINVGLFILAAVGVATQADAVLGAWWDKPVANVWFEWGLVALWYGAWLLALVLGLVLAYVFVLLVGGIAASPFNDALSERAEQFLTGRAQVPPPGDTFVGGVLKSIGSTAAITGLYLLLMGPVLLLNWIPGLGSMAAAGAGAGIGAFFLALEYADTTFERHGLRLREKLRLLRANKARAGGFGLGTSLLLWIPLLNFYCIPIAVVGGTALALVLMPAKTENV